MKLWNLKSKVYSRLVSAVWKDEPLLMMEGFLDIEFIIVQSTNILTNHYYHILYLDLEAFTSALLAFLEQEVSLIWDVNNILFKFKQC